MQPRNTVRKRAGKPVVAIDSSGRETIAADVECDQPRPAPHIRGPPTPVPLSPVLTVKEVMRELRMSRNAIYEAIAKGQIPSIRIGRKILIPRAAYERMLQAA